MTKIFAAAALAVALTAGAIVTTTPADAAPTYGFSISSGSVNPFSAEDGR